jgi:hypothetical protein
MNLFVSGLLFGAGVGGHVLRLVELSKKEDEEYFPTEDRKLWRIKAPEDKRGRYFVAISAILLYGLASALAGFGVSAGLWIAIIGPMVGVSAVLILGGKVDRFQIALGVFQVIGAIVSAVALWRA